MKHLTFQNDSTFLFTKIVIGSLPFSGSPTHSSGMNVCLRWRGRERTDLRGTGGWSRDRTSNRRTETIKKGGETKVGVRLESGLCRRLSIVSRTKNWINRVTRTDPVSPSPLPTLQCGVRRSRGPSSAEETVGGS